MIVLFVCYCKQSQEYAICLDVHIASAKKSPALICTAQDMNIIIHLHSHGGRVGEVHVKGNSWYISCECGQSGLESLSLVENYWAQHWTIAWVGTAS